MQSVKKLYSSEKIEVFKISFEGNIIGSFILKTSNADQELMSVFQKQMNNLYSQKIPFCLYIDSSQVDSMGLTEMNKYAKFLADTEDLQKQWIKKICVVCNWKGNLVLKALTKIKPFSSPSLITESKEDGWNYIKKQ